MKDTALKWLYAIPGGKKLYIVALIVVQALLGASGVLYALFLRDIVDAAAVGNKDGFWRGMIMIISLVAVQLALRAVIRWLTELSKSTFENIFKTRLTETLLRKDYLRVSAVHSGEWLNRLTNDTVVVANGYVEILPGLAGMVVKLVSALIMIIALEPRFAAIFIPGGLLLVLFTWLFRRVLKRLHKNVQEADGRLRVFLQERISSLLMIRSFAAEDQTETEAAVKMAEHKAARMRKNRFSNFCNIGFGAAMSGMYLLGIGWCGYGILIGTISFGTLTAITQLITQIQTPFANITGYLPRYYAMLASAERLMEAEAFADDAASAMPLEEADAFYDTELGSIGLKDACFTYYPVSEGLGELDKDEMPVVLQDLSLEIGRSESVAFVGQSGCGKSTALKLLMCVYQPDSGERFFTDRNGR
ncbi:MAG: ABC transporter ATP-binding protein/permease, partial [Clostridiales bacterium]|nr:ABC transporter ATP-binding protein/permease [Clostridiales bacterium]